MASANLSRSVMQASDEVKDIFCEPCLEDGNRTEADGFCVDCSEYLCGNCYKNHTRYKAFRHHVLQDKDSMSVSTANAREKDVCKQKCSQHPGKVIEYYCQTCDSLGCMACIIENHRQCESVEHIPKLVQNLETNKDFNSFVNELEAKLEIVMERTEDIKSYKAEAVEMKAKAKAELKERRDEINKLFDKLERDMARRIVQVDEKNQENLTEMETGYNVLSENLERIKNEADKKQQTGQRCELFIHMKNAKKAIVKMEDDIETLGKRTYLQRYALTESSQVKDTMKNISEICRFSTAKYLSEISISTSSDKTSPIICGQTIVQNHFVAVADSENISIKLIDARKMLVTSERSLNCEYIWAITNVTNDRIAVSAESDNQNQIKILSISASGHFTEDQSIILDGRCSDMVYGQGNIFLLAFKEVLIVDIRGKLKKQIKIDYTTNIALSPDQQALYLINNVEKTVKCVTLSGELKAVCKELKSVNGLTVDSDGLVYVYDGGRIIQLTSDLKQVQILIESVGGSTLAFSDADKRLYVGSVDTVEVYQLG